MQYNLLKKEIENGKIDEKLAYLYGKSNVETQKNRYLEALSEFAKIFGDDRDVEIYSAPGRTEVAGNHTDHNAGRVLAASVNLDVIAIVSKTSDNTVRLQSKGYPMDTVSFDDLEVKEDEINKSASLIRGVAKKFTLENYKIGGFDAYTTSNVLKGSGLSSSAAFEVLVGTILSYLYNDGTVSPVDIAKYAQYAENVYFGKPSGLMDQMASSVGNMITIDFADVEKPVIEQVEFDFNALNCALCIVDTGGNHADLTNEYAAIPDEMKKVASLFGKKVLRGITMEDLLSKVKEIREKFGDRALLRSMHFISENERVGDIVDALKGKDYNKFLNLLTVSGNSSFRYLQNVYANIAPKEQGLSVALFMSERFLKGEGATRVHGGGFGGTTFNLVPTEKVEEFKAMMENIFGKGCCHILSIRPVGGTQIIK